MAHFSISIAYLLQMYYRCSTDVLHNAHVLQMNYRYMTGVLQMYYRIITDVSHICITDVLQMYYTCNTYMYYRCITDVLQMYNRCITDVWQACYRCITTGCCLSSSPGETGSHAWWIKKSWLIIHIAYSAGIVSDFISGHLWWCSHILHRAAKLHVCFMIDLTCNSVTSDL